jgi:hypothetical protein
VCVSGFLCKEQKQSHRGPFDMAHLFTYGERERWRTKAICDAGGSVQHWFLTDNLMS